MKRVGDAVKRIKLLLPLVFVLLPLSVRAQVKTGTPPFGSYGGGPDAVNLANLNVHLSIPVIKKAGRGLPFDYALSYNSAEWYPVGASGSAYWYTNSNFSWGWSQWDAPVIGHLTYQILATGNCYSSNYPPTQTGSYEDVGGFTYYGPKGTPHQIATGVLLFYTSGTCSTPSQNLTVSGTATDGSGDQLVVTANSGGVATWTVTEGDGTKISQNLMTGVDTVTDRNGNQITTSLGTNGNRVFTDSLGQTVLTTPGPLPPNPAKYTYTSPSGSVSYTVNYVTKTVRTNFGCSGVSEYGPYSESLVSSVVLPDGSEYTFSYEPTPGYTGDVTGRIAKITLPTGGSITYSYSGGSNGITCADGTTATLTRTVSPGGSEPSGTWTYTHTESSSTSWTTTVTDPAGNQTVIDFQGIYGTEEKVYEGSSTSGTLLKTVDTCYNGAAPPCTGTSISLPITKRNVYTEMSVGSSTLESEKLLDFNGQSGALTEEDDYGFGSGGVGPLLRKTLISYASLGNNITTMPSAVTVENGSGTTVAKTNYSYDQTGVASTSGTPQHVAISGSRGNVTTLSTLVSGSTYLTKTFTYFDTGNVDVATDVNGAQASYTYGDCGNSFPTTVDLPLSLTKSMSWNCTGGVETSSTGVNGHQTTYSYSDPNYWRVTQVSYPDGGWKLYTYPSQTEANVYTGITTTGPSTSCSSCQHDESVLDGLGRAYENILVNDPSGEDTVTTTYNGTGYVSQVTNPDRSGAATNGTTTTTYDGLGRPTSVTRPDGSVAHIYYGNGVSGEGGTTSQLCSTGTYGYGYPILTVGAAGKKHEIWADGLGRTIEVDEPNSSNGLTVGTCYEHDANGHLTRVDALATGQTRTYAYDDLGRVTSATTPETKNAATTYTYGDGNLASKKDAEGVTTTYGYDQLHRVTSVSYSDGTHTIDYYYGQASYNGLTISNGKGHRTGMSDGSGETAWSYDSMGRILTERKTIAGVTKNISYSYNLDGSLARLTYPDGSYVNYSFNNAGLPTQAVGSNGVNYATNATYWPQGALNKDVHGNVSGGFAGISETWNYNNDLEPTSIVASSSAGTALSLSYSYALPGGNNGTVAGVDNGNSSGRNQTFTYDPLDRILTAQSQTTSGQGCWGLNFGTGGLADDALGNLLSMSPSKCSGPNLSVSVNGYNQITNTGFSYNTDGDLTADGQYSYTYNGANELTSAASELHLRRRWPARGKVQWHALLAGVYWPGDRGDGYQREPATRLHFLR